MRIDILTLFPEMFSGVISSSIISRAIDKGIIEVKVHDFREFSKKPNKRVDDYSYGGGAGMIIEVQPVLDCLRSIEGYKEAHKILTTPVAETYSQKKAFNLSKKEHIIIICGHYEGIDSRILNFVDEVASIGDYILTGGELAAMAIFDSVVRLLPNVLGNSLSIEEESFSQNLLEFPQYTRPVTFENMDVPEVLVSGNHENIRKWRRYKSLEATYKYRKDLLEKATLTKEDLLFLKEIEGENNEK